MRRQYAIGGLQLDPEARVLTHDGEPVALGARGVAVLTALVSRANEYVAKAEIMDAAWPGLVVEEANLAVQISAIRRALARVPGGDGWIETLARRGYRFVGPVVASTGGRPEVPATVDRTHSNLPQVLTSFVGREREIAEIKRLLPGTRLLTLTGTGGIGKTRLALQAAAEVLDAYRDGIWFVDLAPLTDPALVPSALAQVLGVKEAAGQPLRKTLCEYLRAKELLLVLDNCEHMLGACADLVDALLRDTARTGVIATSREPLHVATERVYPVSVLPLPDPKADATAIARSDAVQLFVERARQHRPNFDLQEQRAGAVAAICVRLDGIPLALELAAARVAVLPVDQIVRLLDQRFRLLVSGNRELPRQQTLRAMIDWSHELLDAAEQQLFARLSVFAGGWTIAAAEIVGAGEAIAKDDVVYLLIALIEKSLVVADEDGDRYRMLETVREYARQTLAESGSAELVRERHRDYFLALAKESEPNLVGPEQAKWLQRLEAEHDNLRAALEWTLAAAVTVEGLRFCGVLQRFWVARGHFSEGRGFCVRALQMEDSGGPTPERAKTLNAAGVLAFFQGDYPTAWACHEESLAIRQQLCDRGGAASSFNNLGIVAYFQGEFPVARKMYEEALVIQRELGNQRAVANALGNLGSLAQGQQDFAAARALYEECLAIMRDLGDLGGIAAALGDLGTVIALSHGDLQAARRLYEECMAIYRELGNQRGIGNTLINLGDLAFEQGDFHGVAPFHRESLAIFHAMGDTRGIDNSLRGIAAGVAALGNSIHAARIWGAAGRLRDETGAPLPPSERPRYDRHVAAAKAALGDDAAFDRAWADGQALTQAQAFELALHDKVEER